MFDAERTTARIERTIQLTLSNKPRRPFVSVIIPVYNSGKTLDKCIRSIHRQTYTDWEILIIDSNSRDRTKEIAQRWMAELGHKVSYFNISSMWQSTKRNFGVQVALGERIYTHDSDQFLAPDVLENCARVASEGFDAVGVPAVILPPSSGYVSTCIHYSIHFGSATEVVHYPNFVSKEAWNSLGGQDIHIPYREDEDFYRKFRMAGLRMTTVDSLSYHQHTLNLRQMINKAWWYRFGNLVLSEQWRRSQKPFKSSAIRVKHFAQELISFCILHPTYIPGIAIALLTRQLVTLFVLVRVAAYGTRLSGES